MYIFQLKSDNFYRRYLMKLLNSLLADLYNFAYFVRFSSVILVLLPTVLAECEHFSLSQHKAHIINTVVGYTVTENQESQAHNTHDKYTLEYDENNRVTETTCILVRNYHYTLHTQF